MTRPPAGKEEEKKRKKEKKERKIEYAQTQKLARGQQKNKRSFAQLVM